MNAITVMLTVNSQHGKNVTPYSKNFVIADMTALRDNLNANALATITDSSATANLDHTTWAIQFDNTRKLSKLYWNLTVVATLCTIYVYDDVNKTHIVAKGTCTVGSGDVTCNLISYPTHTPTSGNIWGSVLAKSAAATDAGGTLTITGQAAETDLQLNGATQFGYREKSEIYTIYTVAETMSAINILMNGSSSFLTATASMTSAEILAGNTTPKVLVTTPGAGFYLKYIGATANLDATATAYATNLDLIIVTGTTKTEQAIATNGISGTTDKLTNFVPTAGIVQANEGLSFMVKTGNPITGTGTVTVTLTYEIVAI